MMGEMDRIKAIIAQKKAEKEAKEREDIEKRKKEAEIEKIYSIAEDEKAPIKYRQAYIDKKNQLEAEKQDKKEQERKRQIEKLKLDQYLKKAHERKIENAKRLMEKYVRDK